MQRVAPSTVRRVRALAKRILGGRDVPQAAPASGPPYPFARRDAIRLEVSRPYLRSPSVGLEIGAGAFPSQLPDGVACSYFDRLGPEQLSAYFDGAPLPHTEPLSAIGSRFPGGADFLIAHNVLEHTADPIGTLLQWFGHVRPGGIVMVSLPHREFCPGDARRPVASIEHLLLDFAMQEEATSLESREHFIAGCVGWAAGWPDVPKNEFANGVLEASCGPSPEHHFHVFDDALARDVVDAALAFHGTGRVLAFASPFAEPKTEGDIIVVVELAGPPPAVPAIRATRQVLSVALERLARGTSQPRR